MNMKDKLVKTGRKGIFYKARRFFIGSLLLASVLVGVTVTTYISVSGNVKAEEETKETLDSEESTASESSDDLLLYLF